MMDVIEASSHPLRPYEEKKKRRNIITEKHIHY